MSVHASAYIELMHYKRVIVNWLCDNAIGLYQTRVDRSCEQVQSPEAAYTGPDSRSSTLHGGHARPLFSAPGVWTFGRSKVGVGRFAQFIGQLALAENAVRCIWALASCYRR